MIKIGCIILFFILVLAGIGLIFGYFKTIPRSNCCDLDDENGCMNDGEYM